MSDEPKKRSLAWATPWLIVLTLIAYVASEYPAAMLAWRVYLSSGSKTYLHAVNHVYAPLHWLRR